MISTVSFLFPVNICGLRLCNPPLILLHLLFLLSACVNFPSSLAWKHFLYCSIVALLVRMCNSQLYCFYIPQKPNQSLSWAFYVISDTSVSVWFCHSVGHHSPYRLCFCLPPSLSLSVVAVCRNRQCSNSSSPHCQRGVKKSLEGDRWDHSFIHSLTHSLTHSLSHSLISLLRITITFTSVSLVGWYLTISNWLSKLMEYVGSNATWK